MESKVLSYFSSINPLAKRLIEDQKSVKDRYQTGEWERLSPSEQEAELDVYLIPQDYRDKYSRHEADDAVPESFPKLSIPSGEKIIVDMDNDVSECVVNCKNNNIACNFIVLCRLYIYKS